MPADPFSGRIARHPFPAKRRPFVVVQQMKVMKIVQIEAP
jgi:hypothetical protein